MKEEYQKSMDALHATHPYDDNCLVKKALDLFQRKWYMRVIFELFKCSELRFGALKTLIPEITNTMLTGTLRQLEAEGIIKRVQFNEIPPHVEYSLTEKGKALEPILIEIVEWSQKHLESE